MPRWRIPRVSIRVLLALILVVGVALAAWVVPYRHYRRQMAIAGKLVVPKEIASGVMDGEPSLETRPCWQARLIGDKRTGPVTALRFYGPVNSEEIAKVAEFRDLEILMFTSPIEPRGDGLALLAGLPSLSSLELERSGWTDSDLAALKSFRRLEELALDGVGYTEAGLAHLGDLTELRQLYLASGEDQTDASLAFLGRMKELRSLSLDAGSLTDAVLDTIRTLPKLEQLALRGIPITDDGLSRLVGLDRLERLFIHHSILKGYGLASLARLPQLRELVLWSNDDLKDNQLYQLRTVTQLRSLTLMYNDQLTEANLASLEMMAHLKELKIATLIKGSWSDETVGHLKKSLPGTKVDVDYSRSDGTEGALSTSFDWPK